MVRKEDRELTGTRETTAFIMFVLDGGCRWIGPDLHPSLDGGAKYALLLSARRLARAFD